MGSKTLVCILIAATALASPAVFAQQTVDGVHVRQLNDHLYQIEVLTNYDFNVLVSVGDDGVLLVDTGWPHTAEALQDAIRGITDKPVRVILLSHGHFDHIGGVSLLGKEAKIYAHEEALTTEYLTLPPRATIPGDVQAVTEPVTLQFNGDTIELSPLPPGHSDDEILIRFVEPNIVFVGSRIIDNQYIFADPNVGDLDAMLAWMDQLRKDYPDATYSLAHGGDYVAADVKGYSNALRANIAVVDEAFGKGMTAAEIAESGKLDQWDDLQSVFISHEAWAEMVGRHHGHIETVDLTPVSEPILEQIETNGVADLGAHYNKMKEQHPDDYNFNEPILNQLGYELLFRDRVDDALAVLCVNMEAYPESPNVYDSCGEALLVKGDTTKAIKLYRKALEVDSTYEYSRQMLRNLGEDVE